MCTLAFAWRCFDAPIAVAANRDEAYARDASPPHRWDDSGIVAPRDEEAGGTWLGTNDAGLCVAITNRWTRDIAAGDRSRGLLVREALDHEDATAALAFVRGELTQRTYEPFHVLLADGERALLLEHDSDDTVTDLAPGVYVVGNTGWCGQRKGPTDASDPQRTESFFVPSERPDRGREQATNDERVLDALIQKEDNADDWLTNAGAVLGDHEYGVCIHGDGFGTKSASLVRVGNETAWRFADGPPCETAFRSYPPDDRI